MAEDAENTKARTTRDPSGTIKRILAAAREEFGAKGFDGTKVEHIARRAGVSKQLIYLYFAGKDELYGELLKQISRTSYETLLQIEFDAEDPEAAIRTYVESIYDQYQSNPVMAVVTLDQSMHGGAQIRLATDAKRMRELLWQKLAGIVEKGRETGVFHKEASLDDVEFLTVIVVLGCVSSRGMLNRYRGATSLEEKPPEFWREYAVTSVMRVLRG